MLTKLPLMGTVSNKFFGTKSFDRFSARLLPVLEDHPGTNREATGDEQFRPHLFTGFHFGADVSGEVAKECMRRRLEAALLPFAADHELLELRHYSDLNPIKPSHVFYARLAEAPIAFTANYRYASVDSVFSSPNQSLR